jgi:RHS repeat-associated protein
VTPRRFTGQRWDQDTKLYLYGARWYHPALARFIQADTMVPDPANPQSLNRYSYVLNNPLRYTDPSGHWEREDAGYVYIPPPPPPPSVSEVVVWLICDEMLPNAQSDIASEIGVSNSVARWGVVPSLWAYRKTGNWWMLMAMADPKLQAYLKWKNMVQLGADWDHKKDVRERFGDWSRDDATGYLYNYDVWSNTHYGYVGRRAGFTATELKAGAGVAQITDHTSDPSYWRTWFDEPYDQAAIQIGIELYDTYQLDVTPATFMEVFNEHTHLLHRIGPASGGGGGGGG